MDVEVDTQGCDLDEVVACVNPEAEKKTVFPLSLPKKKNQPSSQ
jgi:hypothetical protein